MLCLTGVKLNAQSQADSILEASLKKSKAVGIVAGYSSSETRWSSSVGLESENKPYSKQTPTRIASVTKVMTAVAIMQLVEKDEIDLDDLVSKYYNRVGEAHKDITIRQLLTHASGIRGYQSGKERENKVAYGSLEEAFEIIKKDPLIVEPATQFSYTSYGYGLLGIVIEQVSGISFEAYLKEHIWQPLKMDQTGIDRNDNDDLSTVYHKTKKGKVKEATRTNLTDRVPGGGVYSTVDDMLNFGEGLLNERLISAKSFKEMTTDTGYKKKGNPYGFGFYLYGDNPKYGNIVGHSGTQTGASVQFMLLPDKGAVVFVASNTSGIWEEMFYLNLQLFSQLSASD